MSHHLTEKLEMQVLQHAVSEAEAASRSMIIENDRYEALQSIVLEILKRLEAFNE